MQRESWNSSWAELGHAFTHKHQTSCIHYGLFSLHVMICSTNYKSDLHPPVYWNCASYWISSQHLPSWRRWIYLSVLAVCQYLAIYKRLAYIHLFRLWFGVVFNLKEEKAMRRPFICFRWLKGRQAPTLLLAVQWCFLVPMYIHT